MRGNVKHTKRALDGTQAPRAQPGPAQSRSGLGAGAQHTPLCPGPGRRAGAGVSSARTGRPAPKLPGAGEAPRGRKHLHRSRSGWRLTDTPRSSRGHCGRGHPADVHLAQSRTRQASRTPACTDRPDEQLHHPTGWRDGSLRAGPRAAREIAIDPSGMCLRATVSLSHQSAPGNQYPLSPELSEARERRGSW